AAPRGRRRRVGAAAKERQRKEQPPDPHRSEGNSRGLAGVAQSEKSWLLDRQEVERQQQTAAQISPSVAGRGKPVGVVALGEMRQERVVEHQAAAPTKIPQDNTQ